MKFISLRSALFIVLILITGLCFGQSKDDSKPPVPANGKKQQDKSDREQTDTSAPQKQPTKVPVTIEGTVTVTNQPSAEEQARKAHENAKSVWQKFVDEVLFSPARWLEIVLSVFAGLAAAFSFSAYLAASKQAKIAEKTFALISSPKLSVDAVRTANFYVGMEPVFFVKVLNSGPAVAEDVRVSIRVESGVGGAKYTSDDQTMTIAGNSSREFPIRWPVELTQAALNGFNSGGLEVKGNFVYDGKSGCYCYKYYSWKGTRPEGVPEFIPCKFNPRLTVLIPPGIAVGSSTATGSLTGVIAPAGTVTLEKIPKSEG